MAKVLAVVGARLNSSRLAGKHLLDLAGQPLVARIFERLECVPEIDQIILATTADEYNQPLVRWAQASGKEVLAFDGDVNDLIGRVDAVVEQVKPDVVVYVCGDSPLIEPTTLSKMINGLLEHTETDYVCLESSSAGGESIHEGFYPYRYSVWRRLADEARTAQEREHLGLSKQHFVDGLSKIYVNDDPVFSRLQHRISVDTPSDYRFMSEIYQRWYEQNNANTIVSLHWVIDQIQNDSALRAINAHVRQKGVSEQSINALIVTQCGNAVGLGHLMRMLTLASAFQDSTSIGVRLLIQGDAVLRPELSLLPHRFVGANEHLESGIEQELQLNSIDALVFDLAPASVPKDLSGLIQRLCRRGKILVAVDGMFEFSERLNFIHVPSFYLAPEFRFLVDKGKVSYGWKDYILPLAVRTKNWSIGNKLLVLTGGSDPLKLSRRWPKLLDENLPDNTEIHWLQGPFSMAPEIPPPSRLNWVCHESHIDLPSLMGEMNYALTLHGVSFFELLRLGVPTVLLAPDLGHNEEMAALESEEVAIIADSENAAVESLIGLMKDKSRAEQLSACAFGKMSNARGDLDLAAKIDELVRASR